MSRNYSTDVLGLQFAQSKKAKVWEKGIIASGEDKGNFRKDVCGSWIKFDEYGNTESEYGWEIDHIKPASLDGSDDITNLQPLQWENNRTKANRYPWNAGHC